jgi:hypothetical protein
MQFVEQVRMYDAATLGVDVVLVLPLPNNSVPETYSALSDMLQDHM